jgi:phenylacetate-CoA ligase
VASVEEAIMEAWTFPTAYDDSYFPDAGSRYWFPRRETMPAGEREAAILGRLREVCSYAYANAPFYRRRWDEAGFHPDQLKSLEDFEDRVPVVTKAELRASQNAAPPFGDYLCVPGAERLGAQSFPFGAGAPGMTARCAQWLASLKPAAFYGTPTYALHLAEVAREEGLDPRSFGLRIMFFSGEPGASIPGVRDRIAEAFGAKVFDCGSMAEMSPFMNVSGTAETPGMLCWQDVVYTEVCDPATMRRVPYGSRGTPVYTHLERTSQPMIRLASGDLTLWTDDPTPCGRTYPSLPQGIFGRIDDMFTIRGENVYPSEIDAALNETSGYGGEHRIVISRQAAMDELLLRIEADDSVFARGPEGVEDFRRAACHRLQKMLGLRAQAEILAANTFPRTDFKARRVIDDRAVFRDMHAQIADRGAA